jgi:hypothetical protein
MKIDACVYTFDTQKTFDRKLVGCKARKSAFFDFQLLLLITLWSGVRVPADPPRLSANFFVFLISISEIFLTIVTILKTACRRVTQLQII